MNRKLVNIFLNINQFFKNILFCFLKFLYPNRCPICKDVVDGENNFCINCWKKIQFISEPYCNICGEPFEYSFGLQSDELICGKCLYKKPYYDKAISVFIYEKNIARAIFEFKFYQKTFLSKFFSKLISGSVRKVIDEVDIVVPVPMHIKRLRWRGYSQSFLLARDLAELENKIIIPDLLLKIKHTKAQAKLKNKERKKNLKSVFVFNDKYKDFISDKKIALIDDVITTGTTVNECSKILKENKVKKVFVFSIAKTSRYKKYIQL